MEEHDKQEIIELFNSAQDTTAVHQKNALLLKRHYDNSEPDAFMFVLKNIINIIVSTDNNHMYIKRTVDFFALFCSMLKHKPTKEDDDTIDYIEHPLLWEIFTYLLEISSYYRDTVRFGSCLLINKIFDQLVGSDVSTDMCNRIEESLLIRLQDPKNIVRQQAVIALHRLQDSEDPEDKIIRQFIHLMNSDSFPKVRQLCIENIANREDVIRHIVTRIADVDVRVRLAAYKRLSNFAEYLKIGEKRRIIGCGFSDESDQIKDYVSKSLISKWLDFYEGDILVLLKSVRLDADERDIAETVILFTCILEYFFKTRSLKELSGILNLNEARVIPIEALNFEIASYWRIYVQFLNKTEVYEEEFERVLPELVHFSQYVKEYYGNTPKEVTTFEFLEQQFILKQLILIVKSYDFADVVNRQCLNSLVSDILEKVVLMSDVTELVVSALECSIPNVNSRCQFVNEIISEIMYPMNPEESQRREQETKFQKSKLIVTINCLTEDQNNAVEQHNYLEAERLKHEIEVAKLTLKTFENTQIEMQQQVEKITDIPTIIKYLDIATGLLLSPQITCLTTSLKTLKDDVIQELLIHENDNVRAKALRCYALCCIVDKECASTGIHIFSVPIFAYQSGEECDTQTLLTCIGAVVDLLGIYGYQLIAAPANEVLSESMEEENVRVLFGGTSLTNLIQGLVDLMDDEQYEIEQRAVLGLCQLVLSNRIHSPSVISRLVLKWCSPATDKGESKYITQLIGSTLNKMPSITDCAEQLEEAVLLTIKTLAFAPKISPLADVNIDNIAKFMIALCTTSPQSSRIQANLAMTICIKIDNKPRHSMNLILSKILLMLDIPDDAINRKDLLKICDNIRNVVRDRSIVKNIVKFVSTLSTREDKDDNVEDE